MAEESKISKAQQKAVNKYISNNYDRINLTVPKGKKTCWHIQKIRYLVSDSSVLTVSKKGKIRAKKAGHATIYAVAQNGVNAKIKVSVIAAK